MIASMPWCASAFLIEDFSLPSPYEPSALIPKFINYSLSSIYSEKKWIQPEVSGDVPTPRYCTSLNCWEDKLVSFGGFDGNRLNTLHLLDTVTWEWKFVVTNSEIPEPRSHHTACVVGNRLIVFGGLSQEGKRLADLHVLDLSSFRKSAFASFLASLHDLTRGILFFILATMTWSQPEVLGKPPLPRLGHISVVLNGNVLAVFGGYGDPEGPYQKFNELNLLHFDTMT
jgi:F-box protein 42